MTEPAVAKPWLAYTAVGVIAAVDKLKHDPNMLFALLARAAAAGEWDVFVPALERASEVKGLKLLLPAPDGLPMRYVYEAAQLPGAYWPLFIAILEIAAAIAEEAGDKLKPGKRLQEMVLERAFAAPAVQAMPGAMEMATLLAA